MESRLDREAAVAERTPVAASMAGRSAPPRGADLQLGPRSVLVVDDDPSVREVVATFLTGEGYVVQTAPDGMGALRLLEQWRPELILLDLRMPGLDGAAVVRELRGRQITVPFLVMTGADAARSSAAELGAAGHVAKPLSLPLLLTRITEVCAELRVGPLTLG